MPKRIPTLRDLRDGIGRPVPPPPMTQTQVAVMAGVKQSAISNIERGRYRASTRLLWRLAQVYGVSYEFIVACAEETARSADTG